MPTPEQWAEKGRADFAAKKRADDIRKWKANKPARDKRAAEDKTLVDDTSYIRGHISRNAKPPTAFADGKPSSSYPKNKKPWKMTVKPGSGGTGAWEGEEETGGRAGPVSVVKPGSAWKWGKGWETQADRGWAAAGDASLLRRETRNSWEKAQSRDDKLNTVEPGTPNAPILNALNTRALGIARDAAPMRGATPKGKRGTDADPLRIDLENKQSDAFRTAATASLPATALAASIAAPAAAGLAAVKAAGGIAATQAMGAVPALSRIGESNGKGGKLGWGDVRMGGLLGANASGVTAGVLSGPTSALAQKFGDGLIGRTLGGFLQGGVQGGTAYSAAEAASEPTLAKAGNAFAKTWGGNVASFGAFGAMGRAVGGAFKSSGAATPGGHATPPLVTPTIAPPAATGGRMSRVAKYVKSKLPGGSPKSPKSGQQMELGLAAPKPKPAAKPLARPMSVPGRVGATAATLATTGALVAAGDVTPRKTKGLNTSQPTIPGGGPRTAVRGDRTFGKVTAIGSGAQPTSKKTIWANPIGSKKSGTGAASLGSAPLKRPAPTLGSDKPLRRPGISLSDKQNKRTNLALLPSPTPTVQATGQIKPSPVLKPPRGK